jgi:hypothetical protein
MEEILNLDYHYCQIAVKALNRFRNYEEAAAAMGVSSRTLVRWVDKFNIIKTNDNIYESRPTRNGYRNTAGNRQHVA